MLFILTGQIQTGKTRWLESLIGDLQDRGVEVCGVLAPGVWVEKPCAEENEQPCFEKLGIDNVLLPQGERISLATRRDLAQDEGIVDPGSQSARAKLGWEISDEALARVNEHLRDLRCGSSADAPGGGSVLLIDELGPLEFLRDGGLTEAIVMLEAGPTERFPHAIVVVRESLARMAFALFEPSWDRVCSIVPMDIDRDEVVSIVCGASA